MGLRGSGKTSIIKTISNEYNNKTDIALPLIVPENMSDTMNLMGTILGLLKKEVNKLADEKRINTQCWEKKENKLTQSYNELIEQFCSIQPEYQKVVLNQFTTKSNYNRNYSEIYEHSISFGEIFHDFINELLKTKKEKEDNENDGLILIFVDDIDLSTHRCTDVVKTLITYLSHPKIVTIISGDILTFEEALTLDFLKNDNLLNSNLLNQDIKIIGKKNLLESKKELAYEYLKKIIPPVYRHNVKKWNILDRGEYASVESNENNKEVKNLESLLKEVFPPKEYKLIFDKEVALQMYHIFDETSRGLNNVYNILAEIYNFKKEKNTDDKKLFILVKSLIESIVISNKLLNTHQNILFDNIINFGIDFENTTINFSNLEVFLITDSMGETSKVKGKKDYKLNLDSVTFFTIFSFIDFSSKILKKDNSNNEVYNELKKKVLLELLISPNISGEIQENILIDLDIKQNILEYSVDISKKVNFSSENLIVFKDNNTSLFSMLIQLFLYCSFQESIILFNLIFKDNNSITDFFENKLILSDEVDLTCRLYDALLKIGKFYYLDNNKNFTNDILVDYILNENETSSLLIDKLTHIFSIQNIEINQLFKDILRYTPENETKKIVFRNSIYKEFKERKVLDDNNQINSTCVDVSDDEYIKRIKIINKINENNLWNSEQIYIVKEFFEKYIRALSDAIFITKTKENIVNVDKKQFTEALDELRNIYRGVSETLADKLLSKLSNTFEADDKEIYFNEYEEMLEKTKNLAFNKRAIYGVAQAYKLYNVLLTAYVAESEFKDIDIFYLQAYALSKKSNINKILISEQENKISDFCNIVSEALDKHSNHTRTTFAEKLIDDTSITLEDINNLESIFDIKNKQGE